MGSRRKMTLSVKRLSRRRACVLRRRAMRLKLLNNTQAAHDVENKLIDHQNYTKPLPDIENTNSEVNTEMIHYFGLFKEEPADNYDKRHDIKNHDIVNDPDIDNHYDIENHYDIDNHHDNKEEIEIHKEENTYNENIEYCEDLEDLIIDNRPSLSTICIEKNMPKGRYIVDISFILNEIHKVFDNHARGIECQFKDWKLINSRRRGLLTQFFFKCQMCNYQASIWSEPTETEVSSMLDINVAAAAATITVGISYSQLKELCATMDIVCMSDKTYRKYRENLISYL